jgi:nitrogen fixation/metabolism regulation signal transduction histidine kinase
MKLPVKITLLLLLVTTLFVAVLSFYLYRQLNRNYTQQADALIRQNTAVLEQRIALLEENLRNEMDQLSSSLFTENENVLAAILSDPPKFNPEVVRFADKLRKRTTLDVFSVISTDSVVLSESLHPEAFGKPDPRSDFPFDKPAVVLDESARIEIRKKVNFGQRGLILRGGYFLKSRLEKLQLAGIRTEIIEGAETLHETDQTKSDPATISRTIRLDDYLGHPAVLIRVSVSQRELLEQKRDLIRNAITLMAVTFAFCLLTGYLLSLWISRPLTRLRDAALEMSQGDLDVRVDETGSGEIASLMEAFNRMAEQLAENQRKLLQSERIAAWQEIARHLAHEIKNPLTPIRTSIANLRLCMEKAPEKFSEIFLESSNSIAEEVEKLRHLADEFARFARLPAPSFKSGNLNEVIQRSLQLYHGTVEIRFEAGNLPPVSFDQEQISEVLHNLLQNAIDTVDLNAGGMIKVFTGIREYQHRQWAQFSVEDNGQGMNEQIQRQIFTPYFTTKGKGTGLGLAIVQRIITEHGGNIILESEPGKGTKFEILLPL